MVFTRRSKLSNSSDYNISISKTQLENTTDDYVYENENKNDKECCYYYSFDNLDDLEDTWMVTSDNLSENEEENDQKDNEIIKFIQAFMIFQEDNNIGIICDSMNPSKWIEVDTFIFKYLFQLICENKIKSIIFDYGMSRSMIRLVNFYKNDLHIGNLETDSEILDYVSKQNENNINTDIVLAILRESIGFTSLCSNSYKNEGC